MYAEVEDTKPWYQQFWPWVLIALPATAVVAGIYTYTLAASGSSGLVKDDYYKEGKAINRSLERGKMAASMGLQANMALHGGNVRLLLDESKVPPRQPLVLNLYHATLPGRDQSVTLTNAGAGWAGQIEPLSAGKWYVHLLPLNEEWRLEGIMPSADVATLDLQPAL